ncbi:MAG: YARHG domain-containing protein [Hyphomicrobiales bacterium]
MVKFFRILIATILLYPVVCAAPGAKADVFFDSSQRTILFSELASLSCDSLWLARGEIYARNGFRFISDRGVKAFGTGGWTKIPRLNDVEKYNVGRIKKVEYEKDCD